MLDILSSWLEGAFLETVNQLNISGIILNISMCLESLELAIESKHDSQLCDLHQYVPHFSHDSLENHDLELTTY